MTEATITAASAPAGTAGYTVVEGGLLFSLLRRLHLTDEALGHLRRRTIAFVVVAWLPLVVLSAIDGKLLGGGVVVPFLLDIETHVRLLVALPLLLAAEVETFRRSPPIFGQFVERHLVPESSQPRFRAILASSQRLRNAPIAEILLVALVYGIGLFVWREYLIIDTATWYATPTAGGPAPTHAGTWYAYVSIPIVQFVTFRWYYRLVLWTRLLWQVSRIDLRLAPLHPDRAGGLGFLATLGYAFTMFAIAHGAVTAGNIASRIFFTGARLPQFADQIAVVVILMVCVVFGPLLFFAPQLAKAKLDGLRRLGTLGERHAREFDAKWLSGRAPADEAIVGSPDISSLADLASAYEVVRTMRLAPVTPQAILQLAVATVIPIGPLALTMIPLNELLQRLIGVSF